MKKLIIPFFCTVIFSILLNAQHKAVENKNEAEVKKSKIRAKEIVENYTKALGGKEKLESIKTIIMDDILTIEGIGISMSTKKMGNKFKSEQLFMGQRMVQLFDGDKGYYIKSNGK